MDTRPAPEETPVDTEIDAATFAAIFPDDDDREALVREAIDGGTVRPADVRRRAARHRQPPPPRRLMRQASAGYGPSSSMRCCMRSRVSGQTASVAAVNSLMLTSGSTSACA